MGKGYEDLSRRALIKLGHDYDLANDGKLKLFLTEHQGDYESIRPIETVVERTDQIIETVSKTTIGVKGAVNAALNSAINHVADMAVNHADKMIVAAGATLISKLPL